MGSIYIGIMTLFVPFPFVLSFLLLFEVTCVRGPLFLARLNSRRIVRVNHALHRFVGKLPFRDSARMTKAEFSCLATGPSSWYSDGTEDAVNRTSVLDELYPGKAGGWHEAI